MCKKLMFLISLVLLLALGTSSQAIDKDWTNASPWSVLFADPLNWSPEGIPGAGDRAYVEEGPAHGPVLDRDLPLNRLDGPFGNQFMLIIGDANVIINGRWDMSGDDGAATVDMYGDAVVECTGMEGWEGSTTLNMSDNASLFIDNEVEWGGNGSDAGVMTLTDNASLELTDRFRIGNEGTMLLSISGNASIVVDDDLRSADNGGALLTWIMTGGSVELDGQIEIGDDGNIDMDMSGGTITCEEVKLTSRGGGLNVIDISGSALFDVSDDFTMGDDSDGDNTLNQSGGTLNCGRLRAPNNDGLATINMSGGEINISGDLDLVDNGDAVIYLDGGQINAGGHNHHGNAYSMDITDGVMVIDGDVAADMEEDAALGYINAYGGCGGRGDLMIDFNNVNPGKTTVWADGVFGRAWNPNPVCDEIDVDKDVDPSWNAGDGALQHYIFLSSDEQQVIDGHILAYQGSTAAAVTTIDVGTLLLGTTYYWRVDTVIVGDYIVGRIWAFTVQANDVFDDFEDYSPNPNYVYDTWVDGVVDGDSGSWLELAMAPDPVHGGDQSLWYHYDNSGVERECPYSAATRTMDPALDLTDSGEATLVIWFYGQPDNDVTRMYVELRDGIGGAAVSEYGVQGDDPADILIPEWIDWNIDLADFAGVDLSDVTEFVIGFGHGNCEGPAEYDYGVVYFDDISVYPTRCVPKYGPEGDINDDCRVDWKDIDILSGDWLEDLR